MAGDHFIERGLPAELRAGGAPIFQALDKML